MWCVHSRRLHGLAQGPTRERQHPLSRPAAGFDQAGSTFPARISIALPRAAAAGAGVPRTGIAATMNAVPVRGWFRDSVGVRARGRAGRAPVGLAIPQTPADAFALHGSGRLRSKWSPPSDAAPSKNGSSADI
jgi:hypothetical protein